MTHKNIVFSNEQAPLVSVKSGNFGVKEKQLVLGTNAEVRYKEVTHFLS